MSSRQVPTCSRCRCFKCKLERIAFVVIIPWALTLAVFIVGYVMRELGESVGEFNGAVLKYQEQVIELKRKSERLESEVLQLRKSSSEPTREEASALGKEAWALEAGS